MDKYKVEYVDLDGDIKEMIVEDSSRDYAWYHTKHKLMNEGKMIVSMEKVSE